MASEIEESKESHSIESVTHDKLSNDGGVISDDDNSNTLHLPIINKKLRGLEFESFRDLKSAIGSESACDDEIHQNTRSNTKLMIKINEKDEFFLTKFEHKIVISFLTTF